MEKLYLVHDNELKHLRKPTSTFDMEIEEILKSNLNDYEKSTQYNNILMRYLTQMQKDKQPLELKVTAANKNFNFYLNYLPKNIKKSSEIILDLMSKNLNILDISEKGELIFHERIIPNSNIVDLLKKVLVKLQSKINPIGLLEFQDGLDTINVPKSILNSSTGLIKKKTVKENKRPSRFLMTYSPNSRKRKRFEKSPDPSDWITY